MKKKIKQKNNLLKYRGKLIIPLVLILFIFNSCSSYISVFNNIKPHEKKIFYYLLYRIKPKNMEYLFKLDKNRKIIRYRKIVQKVSNKLNMNVSEYKKMQINRIRKANIRYGKYRKGMFTDRGRILIKYGEPLSISEKNLEQYGKVLVWQYSNQVEFKFSIHSTRENRLINLSDEKSFIIK